MTLIQTLFNKNDLLKAFLPLSQGGQIYLELLLINPKNHQVEGRGFFNDPDFVVEACTPVFGRFQIALSPYAYAPDSIPSRQAYNQFDRSLQNQIHQEKGIPHSISVAFQFKNELYQELDPAKGNHVMQVVYLIDTILGRIPLKSFSLDFGGTSMTARFLPACAGNYPGLTRAQYLDVTRRLLERIEKEMFPQEHKRFQVLASAFGKVHDPLPGTPLIVGSDEGNAMAVTTAGSLSLANEPFFQQIFEEAVEGKKARAGDLYAPANLQGLSQNWEDNHTSASPLLARESLGKSHLEVQSKAEPKAEVSFKDKKQIDELTHYFQSVSQNRWRWPLTSQAFNRNFQGIASGEMLILQCDPFGAESGLHYLLQSAENHSRESGAQLMVFSKRHTPGDLSLFALSRHMKQNPLGSRQAKPPSPQSLAEQFFGLFSLPPIYIDCARGETWEHVARYLEHDYMVRSKKNGAAQPPLAIIMDGIEDFRLPSPDDTFRFIADLKNQLREVNGCLWLLDPLVQGKTSLPTLPGLADYLLRFDFDGSLSGETDGEETWEFSFPIDANLRKQSSDLSLVRIHFSAHGSHHRDASAFMHLRTAGLFKEIAPPPPNPNGAPGPG
jgi:hypothetical protein